MKQILSIRTQNKCPHCGSTSLTWLDGRYLTEDNIAVWEFQCNDCGVHAAEHSLTTYLETTYEQEIVASSY